MINNSRPTNKIFVVSGVIAVFTLLLFTAVVTKVNTHIPRQSSVQAETVVASVLPPNQLQNPSFETTGSSWLLPWTFATSRGANAQITQDQTTQASGLYSAQINIKKTNSNPSNVQLKQSAISLSANMPVTISFSAKADSNTSLNLSQQLTKSPYTEYVNQTLSITSAWQRYSLSFTPNVSIADTTLLFNLGTNNRKIWIDDVSLITNTVTPTATISPTPTMPTGNSPTPTITQIPSPSVTVIPTEIPSITPTTIPTSLPTPTPAITSSTCTYPSQILNLTNWKITLPIGSGSPVEVLQPQLATYLIDPWFKPTTDCTGIQFRAHTSSPVTTDNSSYPRSELREMNNNGTSQASWSNTSGTHTMFIDEVVTAVPTGKKHVVVGQIHDANDDVIVIRLEFPKLFIDINGTAGPTLDANYVLGRRFTVKFVAANGKISIYYNGSSTPAYTLTKSISGSYFKAGMYTQSNCLKEQQYGVVCSDTNYGEAIIYNLSVQHQ